MTGWHATTCAVGDCEVPVFVSHQVRQSAGLLLKNNLQHQYVTTTEDFRNYIKVRRKCCACSQWKVKKTALTEASACALLSG